MRFPVFRGGTSVQIVRDFDGNPRYTGQLFVPDVITVHIGEGDDIPAFEDLQFVSELGFASCGEPDEAGHQCRADDGCLFGFDEGDLLLRVAGKKVFAEEALRQRPVLWQAAVCLEQGVHPGDSSFDFIVFDAVAGKRVVFHYLAGAAASLDVNLKEDGVAVSGDTDAVFGDDSFEDERVDDVREVSGQVAVVVWLDGAGDDVWGDGGERLWWFGFREEPLALFVGEFPPVVATLFVGVVTVVVGGCVVVSAAGFVVAAADFFGERVSVFIDIAGEAAVSATGGTVVPGFGACVFLEAIGVSVHRLGRVVCLTVQCPSVHFP